MTIEYRLEKKVLGGWQQISWWSVDEFDKAKTSYDSCKKNVGYAWRLVKVEVLEEVRLEEEVEILKAEPEIKKSSWGSSWDAPAPKSFKVDKFEPVEHGFTRPGMVGKVWLINHVTKERARVAPDEVEAMLANGWEKGGPKTAFKADGGTW